MNDTVDDAARSGIAEHMDAGRFDEAIEACRAAINDHPNDAELYYLQGLAEEQRGNSNAAMIQLNRALELDGYHPSIRFQIARLLIKDDQVDPATRHLRRCVELDPNHAPAWTLLARLHLQANRRDDALAGLKTALRAEEDHVPALITLATMLLDRGELDEARTQASQAIKVDPNDTQAQILMARVFLAQGYLNFARQSIENARKLDPNDRSIKIAEADLAQRQHRHRDALDLLKQVDSLAEARTTIETLKARSYMAIGQWDTARQTYERLLQAGSTKREIWFGLADAYVHLNEPLALDALCEQAVIAGDATQAWLRAQAAALSGELDESRKQARGLFDESDADLRSRARLLEARILMRGSEDKAVASALRPLIDDPELSPGTAWQAAALCRQANHQTLALELLDALLKRGLEEEEERAKTHAMRVDLLDQLGRYDEAHEAFPNAAWQPAYLGDPAQLSGEDPTAQPDLSGLGSIDWSAESEARTRPILFYGWPCSGRDMVLQTMAMHSGCPALSINDWPARRQALEAPLSFRQIREATSSHVHLMRKRYLRRLSQDQQEDQCLEPAAPLLLQFPHWARVFPNANVVVTHADENYLKMQWRLLGYRQVPTMLKIWRRDQETLANLRDKVPLNFVDISLEALMEKPSETLKLLCDSLSLRYGPQMSGAVSTLVRQHGYRPTDHWKHYFST